MAPVVVDDAVKVSLGEAQVIGDGDAIDAFGLVVFCATITDAVLVQPFAGSVTVTV